MQTGILTANTKNTRQREAKIQQTNSNGKLEYAQTTYKKAGKENQGHKREGAEKTNKK